MADVRIVHGENEAVLNELNCSDQRFALAYLDPPFYSQRDYYTGAGDFAFTDKWKSRKAYLFELMHRVELARTLLLPEGCLVLHLDTSAVHYAKVACDELFGEACFAGQIVWRYRRWPSQCRNLQGMHDVMLRYVRDPHALSRFNQLFEPLSAATVETWGHARQVADWRVGEGGARKRKRSIASEETSPGAPLSDVWDIPLVAGVSAERTGYPTQKPEALIARLLDCFTNEGDAVLDPYCGSGTVPAVCAKRGRGCVSIDASEVAVRIARQRVEPLLAQGSLFARGAAAQAVREAAGG